MPVTYLKPTLINVTLLATLQQGFVIERGQLSIIALHTLCYKHIIPNATKNRLFRTFAWAILYNFY